MILFSDSTLFDYVILPLLILMARIVDVSMDTIYLVSGCMSSYLRS